MVNLNLPSFFQTDDRVQLPGGEGSNNPNERVVQDVRIIEDAGPTRPADIPRLGSFQSERSDTFDAVREQLKNDLNLREERDLNFRLNRAAREWFDIHGDWPSVSALMNFPTLWQYLRPLTSGEFALDPMFEVDGAIYVNDFLTGLNLFGGAPMPTADLGLDPRLLRTFTVPETAHLHDQVRTGRRAVPGTEEEEAFDPAEARFINETLGQVYGKIVDRRAVPSTTWQEVIDRMVAASPLRPGSGSGSGRRGGGGRAARVFDTAEVERNVRDLWGAVLEQDPPDAAALAADYMREANAFWMSEGGNLDFETWLMTKIEATPRYGMWYRNKPEGQSALQYKATYANLVAQFGLQPAQATREMGTSMAQGAGAAGAAERISRTQQVQASSRGNVSQRYAATLAGLGVTG